MWFGKLKLNKSKKSNRYILSVQIYFDQSTTYPDEPRCRNMKKTYITITPSFIIDAYGN